MFNPLFPKATLPTFQTLDPAPIPAKISALLNKNREKLSSLLSQKTPYTWDNLMQPLEEMSDELNQLWSPISHLHAVVSSPLLRQVYNENLTSYYRLSNRVITK